MAEFVSDSTKCIPSSDLADILVTIQNAADDWQKQGYPTALAEVRDMANVGRALMTAIADNVGSPPLKGWHPADCPSEIVSDLLNMLDEATRAAPPAMDREVMEQAVDVKRSIIRQLSVQPDYDRVILSQTDWDIVLSALSTLSADAISQGEGKYLVWSNEHRAWWGPDQCGYTRAIERAGRYDRNEAFSIASTRDGGWKRDENPDEIAIPEADAVAQYTGPYLATPASHASDGGEA